MIRYLRDEIAVFMRYRPLLTNLVARDLKVKYRRSALGVLWSFLNPLLMMLVQVAVFSTIFQNFITPENFPVYLLSAQVAFTFYSEATQLGLESVLAGAGLLKKVYIPKYIFPLEKVIFAFINFLLSLLALFVVVIFTGVGFTWHIVMFPLLAAILFVFNLGVSLILASLTVFFRDIKHFYGVFVMAMNYLTPLFYLEEAITTKWVLQIIHINPLYWFVTISRNLVLQHQTPSLMSWGIISAWSVCLLLVGLAIFKKTQDQFILHI